jgi:23S rRNA-/tRNA-specific pseudouridylate synthase
MCEGPAILHGTDDWLVVDKPVGWHTTGGSGASERPDLEAWLREHVNSSVDLHEAGLVHRLDLFTGGCVLVATNERTRTLLREAMSGRGDIAGAIGKVYLAQTTRDVPERGQFELSFTNRYKRSKKVTVSESGSDKSMGSCRWRNGCDGVIEVQLRGPGRRHQIRAGMAFCGFPLIGDALYGGYVNDASDQVPEDAGPRLHAWRLYVGDDIVESPRPQWASPSND